MCDIKKSFISLVFLAGRSNFEKGRWGVEIIVLARYCCHLTEGFSYDLKKWFR